MPLLTFIYRYNDAIRDDDNDAYSRHWYTPKLLYGIMNRNPVRSQNSVTGVE